MADGKITSTVNDALGAVSNVSKQVGNVIALASSKKELFLKQAINAGLLFIILLVFGCLDFVNLRFHFEYLFQIGYWSGVFAKVVAGVCAFNIGINIMWDTEIKKDVILGEQIVVYKRLMTYKQSDFEFYVMKIFNPEEKVKAYISQINRKIYWLNRFSSRKDKLLYSSDLKERQEEKKTNAYCIKRQELEDLKKDDYIKKNMDALDVRYRAVDPAVFELEVDGSSSYKGLKTVGSAIGGRVKASSNVVVSMIGFSMFLTAIGLEFNKALFVDKLTAIFTLIIQIGGAIGIISWQLMRGMLNTRKIISSEFTQVYVGRNKVLTDYLEWRLTEKKENTKVYDELHKDETVIELTEEEIMKFKERI